MVFAPASLILTNCFLPLSEALGNKKRNVMGFLSSLFGKKEKSVTYTSRQGKTVQVDDAFKAWTSGDLSKMLKAVDSKTNLIDRHFLLQSIVDATYKLRKEEKYKTLCIKHAEKHLQELPNIAPALKKDMGGKLPRITTFQNYATVLTEIGQFEEAIAICEQAIFYGLHDNTKSGYEGRIKRISKKAKQENDRR